MNKTNLIIHCFGQWWRMEVRVGIASKTPMTAGPDIPLQLLSYSDVVYNADTKEMIKNRWFRDTLSDAVLMRIWLEDDLPVFIYNSHDDFIAKMREWSRVEKYLNREVSHET